MNKFTLTATAAIVACGASISMPTWAETPLVMDNSPITVSACAQRYDRSDKRAHKPHTPRVSKKLHSPKKHQSEVIRDWPRKAKQLVTLINERKFKHGTLEIVDCVGSSSNVRVKVRNYVLSNVYRQGSIERGWRFSTEAEDNDHSIIRLLRLEIPRTPTWQVNASGDGIIAKEVLFHPQNVNNERAYTNVGFSENESRYTLDQTMVPPKATQPEIFYRRLNGTAGIWYHRVRVTEIKRTRKGITVTQRYSTNDRFDELTTWTLQ